MSLVSAKLRASARGQECTLRLPGICHGGTETTVLCHLSSGIGLKGMAMKTPDYWAVFGCHPCHDVLDGRNPTFPHCGALHMFMVDALERTWAIWFELGFLRVAGDDDRPRAKPKSSKIVPHPGIMRR